MIGFLGPSGTFTEQAALYYTQKEALIPFKTIKDAILAVSSGMIEKAVVPIENSIEGSVNQTIDTLIFDTNLYIESQAMLEINQNLMVNKNNIDKRIEKVISHPQALGQCTNYLHRMYPNVEIIEVSSTAYAAELVSGSKEPIACISNILCAELYDLIMIDEKIQDQGQNYTSFILLSAKENRIPKIGQKTSLAFSTYNRPGELYRVLDIFSIWDINMTQITSRPMKGKQGEYVFFIDIEDFLDEKDAIDALQMVQRKTNFFKILGSYEVVRL